MATPVISIANSSIVESSEGYPKFLFDVSLSESSSETVSVGFRSVAGTATTSADFSPDADILTFEPGETSKQITIFGEYFGDSLDEADENVVIELFNPKNALLEGGNPVLSANGIILDDDGTGIDRALFVSSPLVVESNTGTKQAVFTVTLSEAFTVDRTFGFQTANGSAIAGEDYVAQDSSIEFSAGETEKTIAVNLITDSDSIPEMHKNFSLVVDPISGIANGVDANAGIATIIDPNAKDGSDDPVINVIGRGIAESAQGYPELQFIVTLSKPSLFDEVSLNYRTKDGTAQRASDYSAQDGTIVFAPGEVQKTISIFGEYFGDSLDESDENIVLEVFDPTNAVLPEDTLVYRTTAIIQDDDGTGSNRALFVSNPILVEGDSGSKQAVFDITLSEPSTREINLNFSTKDGSATAGEDYTAKSGIVTFLPGQTVASVKVDVSGDNKVEVGEIFSLVVQPTATITNGTAASTGEATILDDDAGNGTLPVINIEGRSVLESAEGYPRIQYLLTLSEAQLDNEVRVEYRTKADTADTTLDFSPTKGTVTFAPGETQQIVDVFGEYFGDSLDETDESITLELFNPVNAAFANNETALQGTGIILDDDGTGSDRSLFVSTPLVVEGNSGQKQALFELRLSEPAATELTLDYVTQDETAVAGQDYKATSGQVTFAAGQTFASVAVDVFGDNTVENKETFSLAIGANRAIVNNTGGIQTQAQILDDDAGGGDLPVINVEGRSVIESSSGYPEIQYVLTLSKASPTFEVAVSYSVEDGTATAVDDYSKPANGQVRFAPGQTQQVVTIFGEYFGDSIIEPDETVILNLFDPINAELAGGVSTLATEGTIIDDDGETGTLGLFVNNPSVQEENSGTKQVTFNLELSDEAPEAFSVNYKTIDGTAMAGSDYTADAGTINFAAGETKKSVTIDVIGDLFEELDEKFLVNFQSDYTGFNNNSVNVNAVATIVNDDTGAKPIIGTEGRDILLGTDQDDVIQAAAGKDFIHAYDGNDTINGGQGIDTIIGGFDSGSVVIDSVTNIASLSGGGDIITGGASTDFFKYNKKGSRDEGADLITDFEDNLDKLIVYGSHTLADVANGTFVNFGNNHGIIVEGVNSANLQDDIINLTPPELR